jgi:hypothetical protein
MDAIVTKCLHCDEPVPETVGRGRKKKFCCEAHRKAYSRINGQKAPTQYYGPKPPNTTSQPIDIVKRICPEIRTHTPTWIEVNEVTWKLTRGGVTAWVINVAPEGCTPAWLARCRDEACGPTTLREAKSLAGSMVRGARGDYEVKNPIFELNCLAAHTVNRQPPAEETPYVEPIPPKGLKVHLGIDGEKALQILGCGFRRVTVQLRGKHVILHHYGNTATMKRADFKSLVAANRAYRQRNRLPQRGLLLVVDNPRPPLLVENAA